MSKVSLIAVVFAAAALSVVGCDKKKPAPADPKGGGHTHDDGHAHDDGHTHGGAKKIDDHGHEDSASLGKVTAGGYDVEASAGGEVKAGGELHVNVKVSGGASKVVAVRVWVGLEDGAGSTKSKADAEDGGHHGHAEIPDPMPAGSKLWVEIENEKHETVKASFTLKA